VNTLLLEVVGVERITVAVAVQVDLGLEQ